MLRYRLKLKTQYKLYRREWGEKKIKTLNVKILWFVFSLVWMNKWMDPMFCFSQRLWACECCKALFRFATQAIRSYINQAGNSTLKSSSHLFSISLIYIWGDANMKISLLLGSLHQKLKCSFESRRKKFSITVLNTLHLNKQLNWQLLCFPFFGLWLNMTIFVKFISLCSRGKSIEKQDAKWNFSVQLLKYICMCRFTSGKRRRNTLLFKYLHFGQ